VYAVSLFAAGDTAGAKASTSAAADRRRERAPRIKNEEWRRSFLERIPEHARALELTTDESLR